jgi:replicative DNA helicase
MNLHQNLPDYEDALIGSILINNINMLDVCPGLKFTHFSKKTNQAIWREIERKLMRKETANPITLQHDLPDVLPEDNLVLVRRAADALSPSAVSLYNLSRSMVHYEHRLTRDESRAVMKQRFPHLAALAGETVPPIKTL